MRREYYIVIYPEIDYCLNPCFSGICAASSALKRVSQRPVGLNPCFSGICAASGHSFVTKPVEIRVLILVLVEYAPRVP